tara:strand:+ start:1284 stop:1640 length:357 start_codon:yes stop_codon:yes gene_type:complete
MSFKTLINSNVTNAFSLVGDLATDVQFTNITVTGYDFGNQTVNSTTISPITIKGIITKSYRTNDDKPRINADIILKSSDIDSKTIDNYDSIIFGGNTYAINNYEDNGFIINITVGRES